MSDYIWLVELAIKPGQLENFKALIRDMVQSMQTDEPNTINYQLFISDDGKTCHIYEKYADGEAFKAHLDNFSQNFADRFGAGVDLTAFTVYGNPDNKTRELLDGFGAVIMSPLGDLAGGFARKWPPHGVADSSYKGV